jgi:hypothetical protein
MEAAAFLVFHILSGNTPTARHCSSLLPNPNLRFGNARGRGGEAGLFPSHNIGVLVYGPSFCWEMPQSGAAKPFPNRPPLLPVPAYTTADLDRSKCMAGGVGPLPPCGDRGLDATLFSAGVYVSPKAGMEGASSDLEVNSYLECP